MKPSNKNMRKKGIIVDIIKANDEIKLLLIKRLKVELDLSNREICKDAAFLNFVIPETQLSNYFKHPYPHSMRLSQENILWLCTRYGIRVNITISKVNYEKDNNYVELRKYWPNTPVISYYNISEGPRDNPNKRY